MSRATVVATTVALVVLGGVGAATATTPVTYGRAETKACFARLGATFPSETDDAYRVLPKSQRYKVLEVTVQGPAGLLAVVLVFGRNSADAKAIRARLVANGVTESPGAHVQGEAGNAAWLITVLAPGSAPVKRANDTVKGCLRRGKAPSPPTTYRRDPVVDCLSTIGRGRASLLDPELFERISGLQIPASLQSKVAIVDFEPDPSVRAAALMFLFFGKDGPSAAATRSRFEQVVGVVPDRRGTRRNLAWLITGKTRATSAAADAELRKCLP
jgi:hypothetical protein